MTKGVIWCLVCPNGIVVWIPRFQRKQTTFLPVLFGCTIPHSISDRCWQRYQERSHSAGLLKVFYNSFLFFLKTRTNISIKNFSSISLRIDFHNTLEMWISIYLIAWDDHWTDPHLIKSDGDRGRGVPTQQESEEHCICHCTNYYEIQYHFHHRFREGMEYSRTTCACAYWECVRLKHYLSFSKMVQNTRHW